jgi:hypothetical protein
MRLPAENTSTRPEGRNFLTGKPAESGQELPPHAMGKRVGSMTHTQPFRRGNQMAQELKTTPRWTEPCVPSIVDLTQHTHHLKRRACSNCAPSRGILWRP